jgi:predicted O-methyltransferase YrrM
MNQLSSRDDFPALIDELGCKVGIEIGVNEGTFSEHLLANSKLTVLYGIDPWVQADLKYETTRQRLSKFGERSKLIRDFSPQVASQFKSGSLDFIYIDGDHLYEPVKADLNGWWDRIRRGGLFAGHDYYTWRHCDVPQAVDEFAKEHSLQMFYTQEIPVARRIRPSWYCLKP